MVQLLVATETRKVGEHDTRLSLVFKHYVDKTRYPCLC